MLPEVSISQKIKSNYIDYAKEVNTYRALPSVFDGMKVVQRRLLLTGAKIAQSKLVKSASIIGECMARFHPHGDSSLYEALVGLVNDNYPMFVGQGNWGDFETGAAAYRYTSVRLSDFSKEYYLPYINYAPLSENELGYLENSYIPTRVPLALVNNTAGIGLGIATLIPAFTLKSVINYVDWLESPAGKNEPELKLNYKSYDMDQSVLDSGYGRIQYKLTFQQEGDKAFVVKNHIPGANVKEILSKLFKTEIEAKKLFIRDESGPSGTRFVVGKIWWVNMQDIEARMKKTSRLITANMNWSTGEDKPLVRRLAPKQVLEICLEKYLEAMEKWRSHELEKIRLEKLFQKIKNIVMKKLIKELSWDAIKLDLSLTQEELTFIRSKTVSQLSKDLTTEKDLEEQTERINSVGRKSATGSLRLI